MFSVVVRTATPLRGKKKKLSEEENTRRTFDSSRLVTINGSTQASTL
jgi:hypothetical protein